MPDQLSPENSLAELVARKISNTSQYVKSSQRGTGPNDVKFDVLPAALSWYHTTNYPDDNSPAAGGGCKPDHGGQALWVSEWPLIGVITFGETQEEALMAMEEVKKNVTGYMPLIGDRDVEFPLHPVHFAVPFELSGAYCVGIFFEMQWKYTAPYTSD